MAVKIWTVVFCFRIELEMAVAGLSESAFLKNEKKKRDTLALTINSHT